MRFVIVFIRKIDQLFRGVFIFFLRLYQKISPYLFSRSVCRFYPSCSEYSLQSFKRYNVFKALFLSVTRVLRCNPWSRGGHDPLP